MSTFEKTGSSFSVNLRVDYLKACFHHVSKEKTRYYLCGVNIKSFNDGMVIYVATNGHAAIVCYEQIEGAVAGMNIIIPTDIIKMVKANKDLPDHIHVEYDSSTHTVAGTSYLPTFKPIDGSFPDIINVMPKFVDNELFYPIDPKILLDFERSAKEVPKSGSSPALFLTYPGMKCLVEREEGEDDVAFSMRKKSNSTLGYLVHINDNVLGVAMGIRSDQETGRFGANAGNALSNFLDAAVISAKPAEEATEEAAD